MLPYILANAGGVTSSRCRADRRTTRTLQSDEDEVNGKLDRIMTKATADVIDKRATIDGSLVDVAPERPRRGRGGDPLSTPARAAAATRASWLGATVERVAIDGGTCVVDGRPWIPLRGGARPARAPRP